MVSVLWTWLASLPAKRGDSGRACLEEIKQIQVNALAVSEQGGPTLWNYPDESKSNETANSLGPVWLGCVYMAWCGWQKELLQFVEC